LLELLEHCHIKELHLAFLHVESFDEPGMLDELFRCLPLGTVYLDHLRDHVDALRGYLGFNAGRDVVDSSFNQIENFRFVISVEGVFSSHHHKENHSEGPDVTVFPIVSI
jgi:hypothetical protein